MGNLRIGQECHHVKPDAQVVALGEEEGVVYVLCARCVVQAIHQRLFVLVEYLRQNQNSSLRACERGEARMGNPRCARVLAITEGSSIAARSVKGPPHCGQAAIVRDGR